MHALTRTVDVPRLVVGVALSLLGLFLFLDRLDLVSAPRDLVAYWPLLVIAFGVGALLRAATRNGRHDALWLVGLGGWMLVSSLRLFGFHWGDSWPLILIVAGLVQIALPKVGTWRAEGIWPLLLGAIFLVSIHDLFGLGFRELWPLLLVLAGCLVVTKAFRRAMGDPS